MGAIIQKDIALLAGRLRRAEQRVDGRVRAVTGAKAPGGLTPHWWFPEIPAAGAAVIWMQGCKITTDPTAAQNPSGQFFKPWPSPADGLWWAQAGDDRWLPVGGRTSWLGGLPGTLYLFRPGDDFIA